MGLQVAITVNSEIKRILREKDAGIRSGVEAMRGILAELQKQVMHELGKAAIGSWDAYHLKQYLNALEGQFATYDARLKAEMSGQLDSIWQTGVSAVDAPLAVNGIYTGFHLGTATLDLIKEYANDYLESALGDAWLKVKGELNLGLLGGKTPQEVAKAIGLSIDAGRFESVAYRAETITKTEMGRVFSEASQKRLEQAVEVVPGIEKQWVHAGHPAQARPSHVAANGQHVPVNEPFNIGGVRMMYPRSPEAPLNEVIN